MDASVEVSFYPLNEDYEKPVLDFINRIKKYPELTAGVNGMSTQIFGEYDELMKALEPEIKRSLEEGKGIFVMKVARGCLKS